MGTLPKNYASDSASWSPTRSSQVEDGSTLCFGTLMQAFQGSQYRGKRVRMTATAKAQAVQNWAGLWMRVDGTNHHVLSFDNMQDRPIRGTLDWKQYAIVLDVPQGSTGIFFGILLAGPGEVWLANVQFEIVNNTLPKTGS